MSPSTGRTVVSRFGEVGSVGVVPSVAMTSAACCEGVTAADASFCETLAELSSGFGVLLGLNRK